VIILLNFKELDVLLVRFLFVIIMGLEIHLYRESWI